MRSIIVQHTTSAQCELLELCVGFNKPYAERHGFEYHTDSSSRCGTRHAYWEKLAFFLEYLPTIEDGSLVVWEDTDSLNVGSEDLRTALPVGEIMGMVPMYYGMSGKVRRYYNAGVIFMINCVELRSFWERVYARFKRHRQTEPVIVEELQSKRWEICSGKSVYHLDVKWNVWNNNRSRCSTPEILSWHSVPYERKLTEMREYVSNHS
jgi:hypothetical protein